MVVAFQCQMCGNCCRNMRGRIGQEGPLEIPLFLHMATPRLQRTLGLFEWEIPNLQKRAKELSLVLKIEPDFMFWDDVSGIPLVTQWNLDHDDCPFLSDSNLCRVNEQKPLVCQAFPFLAPGISRPEPYKTMRIGAADCPHAVPLPYRNGSKLIAKPKTLYPELFRIYGSSFVGMLRLDFAGGMIWEAIEELKREWIIYPAIIDSAVLKDLLGHKPIGLIEHLESKCPEAERGLRDGIESIYDVNTWPFKELTDKSSKRKKGIEHL